MLRDEVIKYLTKKFENSENWIKRRSLKYLIAKYQNIPRPSKKQLVKDLKSQNISV